VFVTICSLFIVGISLGIKTSSRPADARKHKDGELLEIFRRYPLDYFGRNLEKESFTARATLLLFLNAKRETDLLLFHKVFAEWNARGLNLVVIADDPGSLFSQQAIDFDGVWVIADQSRELGAFFGVSDKNPSFILFNGKGDRIATGDNDIGYERGVRIYLTKALGLRLPVREVFAPVGQYIQDISWLTDMKLSFVNSEVKGSLFVYLNSFCETCNSLIIMERLREFVLPDKVGIRPIFVLSTDFSPQDCVNLEARYKPGFPIIIASQALADKLRVLREDYFLAELNNIMVLVSNEGEIIACADAECACYRDVLVRAEEIMKNGKGK
jgi:hypothetical protein